MPPLKLLLADDHEIVRQGLRAMLEAQRDCQVVGEAADGRQAVTMTKELNPDVVILDIGMPSLNGLEATRQILKMRPQTKVLILTMHESDSVIREVLDAGARGYILKNAMDLELGAAVRRVVAGEIVLDAQLARSDVLKGERSTGLTTRELEILQWICTGKSNKEIAAELGLSANTVAVHRANIMDALGIHKTAELVVYAIRSGLVNLP